MDDYETLRTIAFKKDFWRAVHNELRVKTLMIWLSLSHPLCELSKDFNYIYINQGSFWDIVPDRIPLWIELVK